MPNLAPIRIVIDGVDRFSRAFNKVSKKLNKLGQKMKQVGSRMTMGVTLPVLAAGGAAVKTAADWDFSMRKVQAKAKVTSVSIEQLREQSKRLGRTTRFSAGQAAEAMDFLSMAGWDTKQVFEGLPAVLSLAAATSTELGEAADITSNIMGAFNMQAKEAGRVSDILAATTTSANVDMQMLSETMKFAGPVANQFGASLEDTAAAAGFLGNLGIQGSQAGTVMAQMFTRLSAPTGEAAKVLKELNIQVADSAGNMKPMQDILQQLGGEFKNLTQQQQMGALKAIFGQRAMKGAGPMLNDLNKAGSGLAMLSKELKNLKPGKAQEMVDIMTGGATGAFQSFQSAIEGVGIAIAESGLLQAVTSLITKFTGLLRGLADMNPFILQTITIFAGLLAAIGPVIAMIGAAIPAITGLAGAIASAGGIVALLSNPIGWIVGGIGLLIALVIMLRKQFAPLINVVKSGINDALKELGTVLEPLKDYWAELMNIINMIIPVINFLLKPLFLLSKVLFMTGLKFIVGYFKLIIKVATIVAKVVGFLTEKIIGFFTAIGKFLGIVKKIPGAANKVADNKVLKDAGEKVNDATASGAAGVNTAAGLQNMPANIGGNLANKQENKITVDFKNMPQGTRVSQEGPARISINDDNGLIMAGAGN